MRLTPDLMKYSIFLLFVYFLIGESRLAGQGGCQFALSNQLCAEAEFAISVLEDFPFNSGCVVNGNQSDFYSFHTNNVGDLSASITLTPDDCNDFLGPNEFTIMVTQILPGADPCLSSSYLDPVCASDSEAFTFQINNLAADADYIMIVASNHTALYGPCTYDLDLEGDAVDLVAGASPVIVTLGENSNLSVLGSDSGTPVNWTNPQFLDNPSSTNPVATPDGTTTFQVSGTVAGCPVTDLVTLTVGPPITIYNTFTPNGDGKNDIWVIKRIERFENALVQVFDRWGQSIYKSVGYAQPWDGTFKGNKLPSAAYYYVIELNSLEVTIPPITGIVSIVH